METTDVPADLAVFRLHAREKLAKLLAAATPAKKQPPTSSTSTSTSGGAPERLAVAIEAALYQAHGHGAPAPSHDYSHKLRSLLYNIPRNNVLLSRIRAGQLSPDRVVALSPEDMLPAPERAQQEEVAQRAYELHRLDHVPTQLADMEGGQGSIECPSCGSKRVSSLRRNAVTDVEEAMMECSCRQCGNTWTTDEWAGTAGAEL